MERLSLPRPSGGIIVRGHVRAYLRQPWRHRWGPWELAAEAHNIATNYALAAYASWVAGTYNTPNAGAATANIPAPGYVALGTGTGTPAVTDAFGFAEVYGTRIPLSFTQVLPVSGGIEADLTAGYQPTALSGTYTEAMLLDAPTGTAAVGTGGVLAGASSLPLAAGAPAVTGGGVAGTYETIYIDDGADSEYASIATTAAAGAASWALQAPLAHAHAAATPIVAFGPHLWAHSNISLSVPPGTQGSLQWSIPFDAIPDS